MKKFFAEKIYAKMFFRCFQAKENDSSWKSGFAKKRRALETVNVYNVKHLFSHFLISLKDTKL